jgi:uncharacterized protein (DUF2147 family)
MKKTTMVFILGLLIAAIQYTAYAASPDDILGLWNTEENKAKVEIFKCANKYCGRIVWLKDPDYPAGSKEGAPGTPKVDHNNPDPGLRKRPVMGLQFMEGFAFAGDNAWKGGKLYDPEKGKTYSGKITLVSQDRLDLRGFIGISLIGRTSKWTR